MRTGRTPAPFTVFGLGGDNDYAATAVGAYRDLWDSINAKRGHPWASNPWVWVVEFSEAAMTDPVARIRWPADERAYTLEELGLPPHATAEDIREAVEMVAVSDRPDVEWEINRESNR